MGDLRAISLCPCHNSVRYSYHVEVPQKSFDHFAKKGVSGARMAKCRAARGQWPSNNRLPTDTASREQPSGALKRRPHDRVVRNIALERQQRTSPSLLALSLAWWVGRVDRKSARDNSMNFEWILTLTTARNLTLPRPDNSSNCVGTYYANPLD